MTVSALSQLWVHVLSLSEQDPEAWYAWVTHSQVLPELDAIKRNSALFIQFIECVHISICTPTVTQ